MPTTGGRLKYYAERCGQNNDDLHWRYAEALELIPYTLAENAGLSPIAMVTELRRRHAEGEAGALGDLEALARHVLAGRATLTVAAFQIR